MLVPVCTAISPTSAGSKLAPEEVGDEFFGWAGGVEPGRPGRIVIDRSGAGWRGTGRVRRQDLQPVVDLLVRFVVVSRHLAPIYHVCLSLIGLRELPGSRNR